MSQKPSLPQSANSVRQALTAYTDGSRTVNLGPIPAATAFISSICEEIRTTLLLKTHTPHCKGCSMSGVEALGRVKPTEPAEPEYQVRYTGKAKYAIVLSGEPDRWWAGDTMKRARSRPLRR